MEGNFYVDSLTGAYTGIADETAITLATTQKALWPVIRTTLRANYWYPGRKVLLKAYIKAVTDGCGAGDAPADIVVSSSQAGVVSKTFGIVMEGMATCRSVGTAGTLALTGWVLADLSGVLSTAQPIIMPTAGVSVVSTIDTTLATNALTFQMQRSGAGVWTATAIDISMLALN
jgi:hypothetical protein